MNNLDRLISQTRIYLALLLALDNVVLLGWVIAAETLDVSHFIIIPVALAIAVVGIVFGALVATEKVTTPIRLIWQAILHLSPTQHDVAAPDLKKIRYGRELLVGLTAQVYQLNTMADQQHKAEQAEEANLKNDFVATTLPLPLIVLDNQENIVYVNAMACNYLHKTEGEMLGNSVYTLLDMSFPNENTFDKWLVGAKANTVTDYHNWERVRLGLADESSVLFDLAAYYNKDNSNGYETMLVIFDHTEQYSQDDQAVSFIALAVHELRTPLTLLRGYIETFEDEFKGKLDDELNTFMHRMTASAEQLAAFVNNILDVARVEDDQLVLDLHEENWADIVQGAVNNFTLRAQVRGIALDCQIAPNIPAAAADRVSVYEIIGNLIDNAIKYSGQAKKIVVATGVNQAGLIETTVQDFGVGIPTSVIPNLFTKFYRNHRNRSQIGGTGLGLYLCKALVTAHGGNIWVRSEEDKGSTFGFTTLPYSQLAEEQKAGNNKDITRSAHGWIKNHSLYRR